MKSILFTSTLFMSLFAFSQPSTDPIKAQNGVIEFKAIKVKENVFVNWSVADETSINEYKVQRSSNGINFTTIGTLKARNSASASTYSYSDNSAEKGVNYYRLLIAENGRTDLSKIVSIKNLTDKNSFTVATQGKNLNIKLSGIESGTYKLLVMNTSGHLLQSLILQHDGSDISKFIDMRDAISKGVYRVTLQGESSQFIKSILVQ